MDASHASYQARLETFSGPKTKSRRTSTRSKKAAPKASSKAAWPLPAPAPADLAYAGFIWKPSSASPDNVQCFSCGCQLDGWEETDVPAYEHLTHSPNCGFAVNVCIRLRNGDPGRTEDDPLSETMMTARLATFADLWPLNVEAGFPSVEQMVAAGWYYDPSADTPDGVTCPYCCLSLDAWDAGDDPMEEHRRRASDCVFFALKELYHPPQKPKATKGKRSSSRSSTSSRKGTKSARTKKGFAKNDLEKPLPAPPDEATFAEDTVNMHSEMLTEISVSEPKKVLAKGRKPRKGAKQRASTVSTASTTRSTRGRKRTSDDMNETMASHDQPPTPPKRTSKRAKISMSSDMPESVLESTPVKTPQVAHEHEPELQPDPTPEPDPELVPQTPEGELPVATPEAALPEPQARTPEPAGLYTPELQTTIKKTSSSWQPINIDDFFSTNHDAYGLISNVIVDSGLDKENITVNMQDAPEALVEVLKAGFTSPEKKMTVEQWVMYNAKRGEEKLRIECERQVSAFESEGRRALAALAAVPTIG